MTRTIALLTVLFFGVLAVTPSSSQNRPEQRRGMGFGRGPGFGGGRGLGFRGGKGMRNHSDANDATQHSPKVTFPAIANHGGVVRLPYAAHQPRQWTKLLVDLTSGGDARKTNAGLEKVAKYVNLYAGAGAEPADVRIAVVFHGDATLAVLNADAYAAEFKTDGNPNMKLLQALHETGVELYVCGQSLISKGADPNDVAKIAKVAVSALTAVVNLQADGFAYVPLLHSPSRTSPKSQPKATTDAAESAEGAYSHGPPLGVGAGRGPGAMHGMQGDMKTLHAMFDDRDKIKRTVTHLRDGAEAVTESDDAAIAMMLQEHVPAMEGRVHGNKPLPPMTFHPIFVELIKHADQYSLTYEETEKGMKVRYQSDDPYVVMLVQEHAKLVSRFIKNGMEEIHAPYELPQISQQE